MKRGTVVGIVVAGLLVLGVGGAVAVSAAGRGVPEAGPSETTRPSASSSATPTQDAAAPTAPAPTAPTPGAYVEYSEVALADAEGTRVLFFHAPWCPQCRALEADITARGVPAGVTILKVDYDSSQDLRQRYDVRLQTTVVALDDAGAPTASFVAYDDPTLDAALAGLGLSTAG